jgi:hypothetical protein
MFSGEAGTQTGPDTLSEERRRRFGCEDLRPARVQDMTESLHIQKFQFGYILGLGMDNIGIFYCQLEHFTAIWFIL